MFYNVDAISGDLKMGKTKCNKRNTYHNNKNIIVTSIDAFAAIIYTKKYF